MQKHFLRAATESVGVLDVAAGRLPSLFWGRLETGSADLCLSADLWPKRPHNNKVKSASRRQCRKIDLQLGREYRKFHWGSNGMPVRRDALQCNPCKQYNFNQCNP